MITMFRHVSSVCFVCWVCRCMSLYVVCMLYLVSKLSKGRIYRMFSPPDPLFKYIY
jgi:hypothetical protein